MLATAERQEDQAGEEGPIVNWACRTSLAVLAPSHRHGTATFQLVREIIIQCQESKVRRQDSIKAEGSAEGQRYKGRETGAGSEVGGRNRDNRHQTSNKTVASQTHKTRSHAGLAFSRLISFHTRTSSRQYELTA